MARITNLCLLLASCHCNQQGLDTVFPHETGSDSEAAGETGPDSDSQEPDNWVVMEADHYWGSQHRRAGIALAVGDLGGLQPEILTGYFPPMGVSI